MTSIDISLGSGWNWISIPATTQDISMTVSDLSFSWTSGDYLKNQISFAEYYTDYSYNNFFGTLKNINSPGDMIKLKVENSGNLVINNASYNDMSYTINVVSGWNWIPYCFNSTKDLSYVLSDNSFTDGDFIKSQNQFAHYYDQYGWFGSLTQFEKNKGYKVKLKNSMTLKFKI